MDNLGDLLNNKANDIDLGKQLADLEIAKLELARFFSTDKARVISIKAKTITVATKSSVFASELRFAQYNYLDSLSKALDRNINRLIIRTGF